ncbi:ORF 1 [Bemisia-associated dicistrovirus 1]|nr:ORF 1 [Bemisia-associated dicistrovirus 1]
MSSFTRESRINLLREAGLLHILQEAYGDEMVMQRSLSERLLSAIRSRFPWIGGAMDYVGPRVRSIGIRIREEVMEFTSKVFSAIGTAFCGATQYILEAVKKVVIGLLQQIADVFGIEKYRSQICCVVGFCLSSLAFLLPKTVISSYSRVLVAAMGLLVLFTQSFVAAGTSLGICFTLASFAPNVGVAVDVHNYASPQGISDDAKTLILDLVSCSVFLTASTSGLALPTDGKSWDNMLRRHSLLHKSFQAYEFAFDKMGEVFERVTRFIYKYVLGQEYSTFDYINEVEDLYEKVMNFSKLENRLKIGRDPTVAKQIENMYLTYMKLNKVYDKVPYVRQRIAKLGAPLIEMFRIVSDKNPKAHVMRKEPVCVALYGPTGIGKSYLMSRMQQDLLKISGRFDPNMPLEGLIYARSVEQEFWDGYMGQPIVVYDDFGQRVDSIQNPNLEFFEIIRGVNIFPYHLHCAALSEKANNPFTSDFLILTTNLENSKPVSIISPEAFDRRIHIKAFISLIPEVCDIVSDKERLNPEKLMRYQLENDLPTYDMSHLRFRIKDKHNGQILTYEEYIVLISQQYKKHVESYEQRNKSNLVTANLPLPTGAYSYIPEYNMDEVQPQSISEDLQSHAVKLPRVLAGSVQRFNSTVKTWFDHASRDMWDRMKELYEIKVFFGPRYMPYLTVLGMGSLVVSGMAFMKFFFKEEESKLPLVTTMVRSEKLIPEAHRIVKHTAVHNEFESKCKECKLHKVHLEGFKPSAHVMSSEDLIRELDNKTVAESPMKVERSNMRRTAAVESPMKMSARAKNKTSFEGLKDRNDISKMFEQTPPSITATSEGILCTQLEPLKQLIRRNVWMVTCGPRDDQREIGFVTVLKGHKALINFHYIQTIAKYKKMCDEEFVIIFRQANMTKGHETTIDFLLKAKPVFRGQHQTEFYIINLPSTCDFGRDLTKHLIETRKAGSLLRGLPVQLSTFRKEGDRWVPFVVAGTLEKIHTVEIPDGLVPNERHTYLESAYYLLPSLNGDCGNVVLIDSNEFARKILGFHFAGQAGKGIASIITYDDVCNLLSDEMSLADPQSIVLEEVEDFPLEDSSFRVHGVGKYKITSSFKSKVIPSEVFECFGPTEMAPAVLAHPLKPDGPMIKAVKKSAGAVKELHRRDIMNEISKEWFEKNIAPFSPTQLETSVLTFEQACKGIEGHPYFPPIKRGKSPGYPYMAFATKGKTDWFGEDEWDFSSAACKELRRKIHDMEEMARHGVIPEVVFVETLKDEKRTLNKVLNQQTRVFSACPMDYLILFRKYFMGFIAYMSRNRIQNESAIGTCAHGKDWGEIVRIITPWQEQHIAAGDFADFDGTFQPQIFDSVCDDINNFYNDSIENQKVRKALWRALVNPLHILGHYIFQFSHGQPSGSPITALSNSIYLSKCIRYVLRDFLKSLWLKFDDHIRLIVYGDDCLISISPVLAEHLTPLMISQMLKDKLGMNYTTATKEQVTEETRYESITEVSFLKRGFSFDDDTRHWHAPLELRSIREMCNWIHKSPSSLDATQSNCNDALHELCHHPKEVFDSYREILGSACREVGIVLTVPNWSEVRYLMSIGQLDFTADGRPFV